MAISVFFRLGLGGPNEWWAKFFQYSLDPVRLSQFLPAIAAYMMMAAHTCYGQTSIMIMAAYIVIAA